RDRVFAWTAGGDTIQTSYGTNCVGVLGADAVLVIDPLISPAFARQVQAAVRRRTNAPVRFVVFTHHHTDHTWGANVFAGGGATTTTRMHRCAACGRDSGHWRRWTPMCSSQDTEPPAGPTCCRIRPPTTTPWSGSLPRGSRRGGTTP